MAPSRGSARTAGHGEPSSHASQVTSKAGGCGSGAHSVPCRGGWVPAFLPLLAPPQRLEALADNPTSTPSVRPCALVQAGTRYARRGALGGTPGRPQRCNPQPHQPGGSSQSRPAYRSPLPIESHQLEEAGSLPTHRGYLHPDRGCDCWASPGCTPQQPGCLPWRGASTPSRCLLASLSQWRDAGHNLWSAPAKLLSSWGGHPKIAQGWCSSERGPARIVSGTSSESSRRRLPEVGRPSGSRGQYSPLGCDTRRSSRHAAHGRSHCRWCARPRAWSRRPLLVEVQSPQTAPKSPCTHRDRRPCAVAAVAFGCPAHNRLWSGRLQDC